MTKFNMNITHIKYLQSLLGANEVIEGKISTICAISVFTNDDKMQIDSYIFTKKTAHTELLIPCKQKID